MSSGPILEPTDYINLNGQWLICYLFYYCNNFVFGSEIYLFYSIPPQAAPQASSTLRSEYDLVDKSPVVLRLSKQRYDYKPAKKAARLSTSAGVNCEYCAEPVTKGRRH